MEWSTAGEGERESAAASNFSFFCCNKIEGHLSPEGGLGYSPRPLLLHQENLPKKIFKGLKSMPMHVPPTARWGRCSNILSHKYVNLSLFWSIIWVIALECAAEGLRRCDMCSRWPATRCPKNWISSLEFKICHLLDDFKHKYIFSAPKGLLNREKYDIED